jgi:hypothetical protein
MTKKISNAIAPQAIAQHHSTKASAIRRALLAATVLSGTFPVAASAFSLYNGQEYGNNLQISLSTTLSYSGFLRVHSPSAVLTNPATMGNSNEGDINLQHGIVGNVFEALPVLDIKDGDYGAHFSGEYFINTTYLGTNQNDQPDSINSFTIPKNDDYASQTRTANGMNGRMLDAFVYGTQRFGAEQNQSVTLKLGQQTLLWGQSLFFGGNGIDGGQAPIDVVQAQTLVNPQSQQIYLPVGQIVATYQPNDVYTLQAYYQYQWEPDSLEGVGSYFSTTDLVGPGGQRLIAGSVPGLGNLYFFNTKALTPPSQNGQFGASVQAQYGNYDVGLFGLRYDAKAPVVDLTETGFSVTPEGAKIGNYKVIYPRDIQLYGASLGTTIGATNISGEISTRHNMPLVVPDVISTPENPGNANSDPLYAIGNTLSALTSFIYVSPALKFDPGGVTLLGEVEYVDVLSVTKNKDTLAPGRSKAASAFDVEAVPTYYNVLPHLVLSFPVSLLYNYAGNSEMDSTMNHGTGEITAGVSAAYKVSWIAALNYVTFFGNPAASLTPEAAQNVDRGYITLNLQHTF